MHKLLHLSKHSSDVFSRLRRSHDLVALAPASSAAARRPPFPVGPHPRLGGGLEKVYRGERGPRGEGGERSRLEWR